ncbi:twin-arginine translocase subunit TatC [soil metagenome]
MPLDQVDVDAMEDRESAEMTFLDHIETLRKHIVRAVIFFLVFAIAAFCFKDFIFDGIIFAPTKEDFVTYRALCWFSRSVGLGDSICMQFDIPFTLINTQLSGQFNMHIQVSAIVGFILAFPVIFWEIWRFIKPGLHRKEVKYTQGIIFFTSILFLMGVAFGYYILMPFSINFFATYNVSDTLVNMFDIGDYISFLTMSTLFSGIVFELPIAVYFLTKLGILGPGLMRNYRRHAFVVLLIIAAIITPADVSSMVMVFIPIMLLYEVSIFISARVEKKVAAEEE